MYTWPTSHRDFALVKLSDAETSCTNQMIKMYQIRCRELFHVRASLQSYFATLSVDTSNGTIISSRPMGFYMWLRKNHIYRPARHDMIDNNRSLITYLLSRRSRTFFIGRIGNTYQ